MRDSAVSEDSPFGLDCGAGTEPGSSLPCPPLPKGSSCPVSLHPHPCPTACAALLSSIEAAAFLNVSVNTLRRYVADGLLTNRRVGPRLLKYDPAELEAFTRKGGDA